MGRILSKDSIFAVLHIQPQETSNYPEASRVTLLGLILIVQVYKKKKTKRKRKKLITASAFDSINNHSYWKFTEINDMIRIINKNYKTSHLKRQLLYWHKCCVGYTDEARGRKEGLNIKVDSEQFQKLIASPDYLSKKKGI